VESREGWLWKEYGRSLYAESSEVGEDNCRNDVALEVAEAGSGFLRTEVLRIDEEGEGPGTEDVCALNAEKDGTGMFARDVRCLERLGNECS